MNENRLPKFRSLERLVKFFDEKDLGEHAMPEANFDVHLKKKSFLVSVDGNLLKKISEVATSKRTSTEKLVNSWLREKLAHAE